MQVSGGFLLPADQPWLALVGAVVGEWLALDGIRWLSLARDS
jgi:hypothetical protein